MKKHPAVNVIGECAEFLATAKQLWLKDRDKSRRFVRKAFRLAMHHRAKLGRKLFCKKCFAPFIHGITVKVRVSSKENAVIWKCLSCEKELRFPL